MLKKDLKKARHDFTQVPVHTACCSCAATMAIGEFLFATSNAHVNGNIRVRCHLGNSAKMCHCAQRWTSSLRKLSSTINSGTFLTDAERRIPKTSYVQGVVRSNKAATIGGACPPCNVRKDATTSKFSTVKAFLFLKCVVDTP